MLRKGVKLLIKKMVDYKKALVAILENTLENVNAGNTNITEEEASVIIDHLTMLNKGVATVSKAYACEHVLHITSNKFDYLVRKGWAIVICLVRRAIRLARLFSCNYGWKWGILTYIC